MLASVDSPPSSAWVIAALVCCAVLVVVALKVVKPILSAGSSALTLFH